MALGKYAAAEDELEPINADTAAEADDDVDESELLDDDDVLNIKPSAKGPAKEQPPTEDPAELARFREEWKADLARHHPPPRKAPTEQEKPPDIPQGTSQDAPPPSPPISRRRPTITAEKRPELASTAPIVQRVLEANLSPQQSRALDIYRRAVVHEQNSELDEALRLYRQAFRLHESVAKVYERIEYGSALVAKPHTEHRRAASSEKAAVDATLARSLGDLHVSHPGAVTLPANHGVVTGTLASLVESWPAVLKFEPEDETRPVHLQMLPDELLVHVLQYLGTTALERFALVNRRARILSLDSALWRQFVTAIYKPPQIGDDEDVGDLLQEYMGDFRRTYIEHPRVRYDGVYIAVCHYIRNGLGESAWVNVTHLITYHRYLRFYPNGEVLSLLANDALSPQQIIPTLKPTLRMKGFFIGSWQLTGTTVTISNLMDPSGEALQYSFQMVLELRSRPLGRWNRLDIRAYESVALETGETSPFPLTNDRPYWFSKVRSYA